MLEPVSNRVSFPEQEEKILQFWADREIFKKSLEQRKDCAEYVFYDGPPFATGMPHYGHLLAGTIKDIVPRYHAMRGHYVERRFGWDCHGLPIEALAQEELGLAGTTAIIEKGIDVFNETCRSMVLRYVEEWRKTVTRMGRWVDFDNDYKTMDKNFMETIWWVFKQLWDQERIYKSHRIMPYSWKLTTPLSNFEAGRNYHDVQDPAITVKLKLTSGSDKRISEGNVYALIWTTTPWTLPGNLALCAGPDLDYVIVADKESGERYLLAEALVGAYYKKDEDFSVEARYKGADLLGWNYEPIFPYFKNHPNAFRILNGDFVSTEEGTGIVHMAPAFGEDDFLACAEAEIALVDYLDEECRFTATIPEYAGEFCKDADKAIIRRLKDEGRLVHQSTIVHSYPYCDRTDTPLIYRAIDAWYVRVEDLRERLEQNNEGVHWVPDYVGGKRFGNWLREAKDWNISRNRFWGSCIPVWVADDGDMICVGSVEELENLSGQKVEDLHKHVVDTITIEKDGKTYKRTPEVLDCWFESGSMPYAQQHYPFEKGDSLDSFFPAHFIAEGLDQTRGWFYTLLVLSTALFDKAPYRNVVVNGLVLAEDGRKMSKRLKNYPDPKKMLDQYGADALRLFMIYSPVVRAENLCFSEDGVRHALRHLIIPLWNAYVFFVTYARIDGWDPAQRKGEVAALKSSNPLDRWIISSLERLTQDVVKAMDVYDLQQSVRPFVQFIEDLTNWYIRRSRRRFWKSSDDSDKQNAYETLYEVLLRLSKIAAPFIPFISESIYLNLRTDDMPESVHLCKFPEGNADARDVELEKQMAAVMDVVSMGRLLRTEHNLKVRQPLKGIHIISRDEPYIERLKVFEELIRDELNVRQIWFSHHEGELVDLKAKPDFKKLGPRFGPRVKEVAKAIAGVSTDKLDATLDGTPLQIQLGDEQIEITVDELVVERIPREGLAVATGGHVVVALETELSEELVLEGLAREFVNKVQNMRKTEDLEVTQRIDIRFDGDPEAVKAIETNVDYIAGEILAVSLKQTKLDGKSEEIDLNGRNICIQMSNASD